MVSNKQFIEYIQTRDHYYKNMEKTLRKGEHRKASELLWGAITQSIKALALLSSIMIWKHGFFKKYTRQVSEEMGDTEYYILFESLEKLHTNFYDEKIDPLDFPIYLEKAKKFLEKTQNFIDAKLQQ